MKYSWRGNPCVRAGKVLPWEEHPCYFCGKPIVLNKPGIRFDRAGFAVCPNCHKGYSNLPGDVKDALRVLRNRYCCNQEFFEQGVKPNQDTDSLRLVGHFADALNYCRKQEGLC